MLHKAYAVLWADIHFADLRTPKHNAFDLISENFENLSSISNVFHKTQDDLFLTESVIMYYLRRSQQIFAAGKASLVLFKKINVNTNLAVVAMLLKCVNIVVCYLTTQEIL